MAALKSICTILASWPLSNALFNVWDTKKSASEFPRPFQLGGWKHTSSFHKSFKNTFDNTDGMEIYP